MAGRSVSQDLVAARAQLAQAEKRARRKMRRLEQQNRARVAGTQHDPTVGASVERLNSRQVAARLERVQKFNHRSTQFHGDAVGRLLSESAVKQFQSVKRRYNAESQRAYEPFRNIQNLDGQRVEVWHELKANRQFRTKRNYDYVVDISTPIPLSTVSFESEAKMLAYTRRLEKKLGSVQRSRVEEARQQFADIMRRTGDSAMRARVHALSDRQFELLWHHSSFIEELALKYAEWTEVEHNGGTFDPEDGIHRGKAMEYVKWASKKRLK